MFAIKTASSDRFYLIIEGLYLSAIYRVFFTSSVTLLCAYLFHFRRIYKVIGLAVFGIGLVVMPLLQYLIYDPVLPGNLNLYTCYVIFLGDAAISYLLFGYMTVIPTVYQRRDVLSRADMVMCGLKCFLQSMFLLFCDNFYYFLFTIPIATISRNLFIAYVVRKKYPEIKCRGEISQEQKKDLFKKVKGIFINKLCTVSRNSIDSLCISSLIGLAATGIYNNYFYIFSALLSFSGVVCSSMVSSVGNSLTTETQEKNYSDLRLFDYIYMAIASWASVSMLCLCQPFIHFWLGEGKSLDTSVVIGFSLYFFILKSGDIRWVYHEGAGLWYECRKIMIGEVIANIVLNVFLCRLWGIFGIVLATVVSVFATNMIFCPKVLFQEYFKNGKLKEYWKDHAEYTVTMLLTAVSSWFICEGFFPSEMSSITNLFGRLLICSLLSIIIFWVIWHRSERYRKAVNWLKRMMKV